METARASPGLDRSSDASCRDEASHAEKARCALEDALVARPPPRRALVSQLLQALLVQLRESQQQAALEEDTAQHSHSQQHLLPPRTAVGDAALFSSLANKAFLARLLECDAAAFAKEYAQPLDPPRLEALRLAIAIDLARACQADNAQMKPKTQPTNRHRKRAPRAFSLSAAQLLAPE